MKILNQSGFKRMTRKRLLIILCLVVLIGGGWLLVRHEHANKLKKSAQISHAKGIAGAASFAQKVYNAYLPAWDNGQRAFINNNQTWFTKSFLARSNAKQTAAAASNQNFLFCSTLPHRPTSFKVAPSILSADSKTAVVYVNAIYAGKPELINLPVQVKDVNNAWTIDSVSCSLN